MFIIALNRRESKMPSSRFFFNKYNMWIENREFFQHVVKNSWNAFDIRIPI